MQDELYTRHRYLNRLRPFYHADDLIKVITGIRRCGKSCLLASIARELIASGVPEREIVYIDLDSLPYHSIVTPAQLHEAIETSCRNNQHTYLFIDEIQNVDGFEALINAYRNDGGFSIFLTGSNSYLLSGELTTKLTGRYIELEMFPLSFSEYLDMKAFIGESTGTVSRQFEEYLSYGGFPRALSLPGRQAREEYVREVIAQIFERDVRQRKKIRNRPAFDRAMTYLLNNYGSTTNLNNIIDYLGRVEHITVKSQTLSGYIDLLCNAKLLYRCPRFDLKSRRSLRGEEKYYLADPAIYFARNADARINYGPALENVLYNDFISRGYSVSMGKIGGLECDFIVRSGMDYAYVQVAMSIVDPKVAEREFRPFEKIRDAWPRYLFTLDPLPTTRDGIRHINIIDYLQADKGLFMESERGIRR